MYIYIYTERGREREREIIIYIYIYIYTFMCTHGKLTRYDCGAASSHKFSTAYQSKGLKSQSRLIAPSYTAIII